MTGRSDEVTPEERMLELAMQGFGCSQILMSMALEARHERDPALLRAVSGLHGGVGGTGKLCGALTGGACVLALHGGKGSPEEHEDARVGLMVASLVEWFEETCGARYGGTDCAAILGGDPANRLSRCQRLVAEVWARLQEILKVNDLGLARDPRGP